MAADSFDSVRCEAHYRLTGLHCPSSVLQDALYEAAEILINQDALSLSGACAWFNKAGLSVRSCPRHAIEVLSVRDSILRQLQSVPRSAEEVEQESKGYTTILERAKARGGQAWLPPVTRTATRRAREAYLIPPELDYDVRCD
jgi:hypothetical protein